MPLWAALAWGVPNRVGLPDTVLEEGWGGRIVDNEPSRESRSREARLPGYFLTVGSLLFLVNAFSWWSLGDFFDAETDEERIAALEAVEAQFTIQGLIFGVAAVLTGWGMWLLADALRQRLDDGGWKAVARWAGVFGLVSGFVLLLFGIITAFSTAEAIVEFPIFGFYVYLVVMVLAMAGLGLCLLRVKHLRWAAWILLFGAAMHVVQVAVTGDVLPLTMYAFVLPAGIGLIRRPVA